MAKSINIVTLCGRLGKDPEIREIGRDNEVAKFSLATDRYKSKDGEEITDWHQIVIFRRCCEGRREHAQGRSRGPVIGQLQQRFLREGRGAPSM